MTRKEFDNPFAASHEGFGRAQLAALNDDVFAEISGLDAARLFTAAPDLLAALTKLSNEVMGTLPLMEALARQAVGNTNYNILIQRAEEARAVIAKAQPRPGVRKRLR